MFRRGRALQLYMAWIPKSHVANHPEQPTQHLLRRTGKQLRKAFVRSGQAVAFNKQQ
jgi:hypothetical protein